MTILALPKKDDSKATQPINHWNQFTKGKAFELSKSGRGKVYISACKYSNALLGKVGLFLGGTQVHEEMGVTYCLRGQ